MPAADYYLIDEGHRTVKDATLNKMFISVCENKTYGDVFSEAAFQNKHYFILWAILALNAIYFFLVVLFDWRNTSARRINYYCPLLRKQIGLVLGTFAVVFCEKVISTEEFCPSAAWLVFVSFLLSVLALLVAFGTTEKPPCLIPFLITAYALGILVWSIVKYSQAQPGQDFIPLTLYALSHMFIGIRWYTMYRPEETVPEQQWHL